MQDFDRILKELFQGYGPHLTRRLAGAPPREWLNVELAATAAPRVDLVAWLEDGALFHLEFQSSNESPMALRMLEYYVQLWKRYTEPPRQTVLYIGNDPVRMPAGVDHPRLNYRYDLVDAGGLDAEELLASPSVGDNILAVLCRAPGAGERVRRIVRRLAVLEPELRKRALRLLLVLSSIRGLAGFVGEEAKHMPVHFDIFQDKYFADLYEKVRAEATEKGRAEGRASFLLQVLAEHFGPLPSWADERVKTASAEQLNAWAGRLFGASTLEDVLGRP